MKYLYILVSSPGDFTTSNGNLYRETPRLLQPCCAKVGNFAGELFNSQGHLGAAVAAAHPALLYRPSMRVEAVEKWDDDPCTVGSCRFLMTFDRQPVSVYFTYFTY